MAAFNAIPAGYEDDYEDDEFGFYDDGNLSHPKPIAQKSFVFPDNILIANGEIFERKLSYNLENWLLSFQELWDSNPSNVTAWKKKLKDKIVDAQQEQLLLGIKLVANCRISKSNKIYNKYKFPTFILENICDFQQMDNIIKQECDDKTRLFTFCILKSLPLTTTLCDKLLKTYQLCKVAVQIIPLLKDMVNQNLYRETAFWAARLGVCDAFSPREIALPLFLQGNQSSLHEFLRNVTKEQQLDFFKCCDELLARNTSLVDNCMKLAEELNVPKVNFEALNYRNFCKQMNRFMKMYELAEEDVPNLHINSTCRYLRHFYYRYREGHSNKDSWLDIIKDTTLSSGVQLDMLDFFSKQNNIDEIVFWIKHFNIPAENWPIQNKTEIMEKLENVEEGPSSTEKENTDSFDYLELELPTDNVKMVSDKAQFHEMLKDIEMQSILGLDCEWKTSKNSTQKIALLQLATFEYVYLIDCIAQELQWDLWLQLTEKVLDNNKIWKVCFDISNDLIKLGDIVPIDTKQDNLESYLDLYRVFRHLKQNHSLTMPYGDLKNYCGSLSGLTEMCLGKKLDKTNQCSNWNNRPLRDSQKTYAALDAFCLLQIYEIMQEELQCANLNLDKIVERIYGRKIKQKLPLQREKKFQDDIKFACDDLKTELCYELRKLGFNCTPNVGTENGRIILTETERTDEQIFKDFECISPMIIKLRSVNCTGQVVEVLNTLQLKVTEADLYTRCVKCNNKDFIIALSGHISMMQKNCDASLWLDQPILENEEILAKKCKIREFSKNILTTKRTDFGKKIHYEKIDVQRIGWRNRIFICNRCGDCAWNGKYKLAKEIEELIIIPNAEPTKQ